jgi:low affinity Fe/Cu permease
VSGRGHTFDRFAEASASFVSRAPFFFACVLLILIWAPTVFLFPSIDTWQLIINTVTTIITFLLVALLQNSQRRGEHAIQEKLDAIADGLADLMRHVGGDNAEFAKDIKELEHSVGLEQKEAS